MNLNAFILSCSNPGDTIMRVSEERERSSSAALIRTQIIDIYHT